VPEFTVWGTPFLDSLLSVAARLIPLLILGECFILYFKRRERFHFKDFFNNLSNGAIHRYVNLLVWTPFYFLLHSSLQKWALFDIQVTSVLMWVGVFVLTDFCYYWFHRLLHRVPLLWTFHDSHHSSPYVNWLSAFRLNWLIGGLRALSHIPITLLGVNPQVTYFCYIMVLVYQIFIHSEYMNFSKPFEMIFNSPGHHRIHHSKAVAHHDSNFGGVFIFWDKLFGTYQEPAKTPLEFGVAEHDGMANPFYLNFAPMFFLFQKAWTAKRLSLLFVADKRQSENPEPMAVKLISFRSTTKNDPQIDFNPSLERKA